MNTTDTQDITDTGQRSQHRDTTGSTQPTKATDEQLDAAIMAAVRDAGGELLAWAKLRERLPAASNWSKDQALVRLHQSGKLCALKADGRTYIDPIVLAPPRP